MGMKPRKPNGAVDKCAVCGAPISRHRNRKTCSPECAHKRRMAKQLRRRKAMGRYVYSWSGLKEEWGD